MAQYKVIKNIYGDRSGTPAYIPGAIISLPGVRQKTGYLRLPNPQGFSIIVAKLGRDIVFYSDGDSPNPYTNLTGYYTQGFTSATGDCKCSGPSGSASVGPLITPFASCAAMCQSKGYDSGDVERGGLGGFMQGIDWQQAGTTTNNIVDFFGGLFGKRGSTTGNTTYTPPPPEPPKNNTALWVVGGIVVLGGIGFAVYKLNKK